MLYVYVYVCVCVWKYDDGKERRRKEGMKEEEEGMKESEEGMKIFSRKYTVQPMEQIISYESHY